MHNSIIIEAVDNFMHHHKLDRHVPIISAGAAMHIHGLREGVNDIDLYIPTMRPRRLSSVHNGLRVEAFNTWPGMNPDTAYDESVSVHGVRVMSRPQLLVSYMAMNRPKDQPHIALLMGAAKQDAPISRTAGAARMRKMAETLLRLMRP